VDGRDGRSGAHAGTVRRVPGALRVRVGTANISSGRGPTGFALTPAELRGVPAGLDVDVLAVQEVDARQPRSHGSDQAAVLADGLGAVDWRGATTLTGTPDPFRTWAPAEPALRGPVAEGDPPAYGIALLSRVPVRGWSVLGLGSGWGRLPVRGTDPRTGRQRVWWFPDEPRIALAAHLDGLTVVTTHLSFAPHTAVRQLVRLRRWLRTLPGPVVLAGDLNLPGAVPARVLGGRPLVRQSSFPAAAPRVQLDHVLAVGALIGSDAAATVLPVGDHRALAVTVTAEGPRA
jgi:endonuclease/exonuclease/phosphatase family metal-dependent hydrolase